MFLIIFVLRMAVVLKFDEKTKASWFHRVTLVLSLCITDAAWNKSTEQPWLSKNIIWALTGLTTLENIVALFYAAFSESEVFCAQLISFSFTLLAIIKVVNMVTAKYPDACIVNRFIIINRGAFPSFYLWLMLSLMLFFALLSQGSKIPVGSAVVIVLLMIMLITLRIILLRVWALPVHYPEVRKGFPLQY